MLILERLLKCELSKAKNNKVVIVNSNKDIIWNLVYFSKQKIQGELIKILS